MSSVGVESWREALGSWFMCRERTDWHLPRGVNESGEKRKCERLGDCCLTLAGGATPAPSGLAAPSALQPSALRTVNSEVQTSVGMCHFPDPLKSQVELCGLIALLLKSCISSMLCCKAV